ncbi:MAG: hypothetical protein J6D52_10560 [Clostridia bacterium]|nr:hypothetical protein [Clostridia bacterium]
MSNNSNDNNLIEAVEFYDEDSKPSLDEMLKINEQMIQSSKNKNQSATSHPNNQQQYIPIKPFPNFREKQLDVVTPIINTGIPQPVVKPSANNCPQIIPPQIIQDVVVETKKTKTNGLTAYDVASTFKKQVPLFFLGKSARMYNGLFYFKASELDVRRMIRRTCAREVVPVGTSNFVKQVYDALVLEPDLIAEVLPECHSISFIDGVYDLKSGVFYNHSPNIFTSYIVDGRYRVLNNHCPIFDKFLDDITGGNIGIKQRIWEMLGYIISPDMSAKKFFVLQGCGNSGKSVLSDFIRGLFNPEAVFSLDVHDLNQRFAVAELEGKAVCISPDLPSGPLDNICTSKLKQLSGNDIISADVRYEGRTEFRCTAKFVLATNHPLLTKESDQAFVDRIVAIPFLYTTPIEKRDPLLLEKLRYEQSVIINKALDAYLKLRERHYVFSGDYELNSAQVLYQNNDIVVDVKSAIYSFLRNGFIVCEESGVFTQEAYEAFVSQYGSIHINLFSQNFAHYAGEIFGAKKSRSRQDGDKNPTSYIKGIKFKEVQ